MENTNKYRLYRGGVFEKAFHDCVKEMYEKAQPPADYDEYIKQVKDGKITDATRPYIYQRHYLSEEETKYIAEKYIDAYRMRNEWKSNIDLLIKDLEEGCSIDKYIPEHTDEYGNHHPGHRGYEHRDPLVKRLENICGDPELAKKMSDEVFDYIENRKNFYRFDREEEKFNVNVFLGSCPSHVKEEVIDYWKSQGTDIDIVERDPRTFWMIDEGYSDEEIAEELGEYNEVENEEES